VSRSSIVCGQHHRALACGRGEVMSEIRDLQLPADLCAAVEGEFGRVFGSLEELLIFILRDLLRDEARIADQAEQRLVDERLRELGYL